jgi:predicted transcriptional regulator
MKSLRLLRHVLDLSARRLAQAAGVSERELRRIETGAAQPTSGTLRALDAAFAAAIHQRIVRATREGRT